jgi:hypothetical protein
MRRPLAPAALALLVFGLVAALMTQFMPKPLGNADYLVIGSVATLVALGALFLVLVSTTLKSGDVFFKKRKKR